MREMLFKAKRLDNGEWIEGVPVDVTPLQCFAEPQKKEVVMVRAGFADWGMPRGIEGAKVDPDAVCQYTGLTDAKGKKVFEGDVLRFTDDASATEWLGVIVFGNPNGTYTWGWQITHVSGDAANTDTLLWFDMEEGGAYSVVIGNIHDKEAQECSV